MFSAKKLNKLVSAKIISEAQKQQILDFEKNNNSGIIAKLLVILGLFTFAIGIISLVASNWMHIAKSLKLVTMFAALSATGILSVYYKQKGFEEKTEKTLLLLFLLCGAAIGLMIQVFQLQGGKIYTPLGFWCLLGIPLLAAAQKKYVAWFWIPLFFAWFLCYFLSEIIAWKQYTLWCLCIFGTFTLIGLAIEKFLPSRNSLCEVLKKDSLSLFYLSLAVYIITGFEMPLRFAVSAMILLCLSFLYYRFRAYTLIRRNIKFFGFLVIMLYIYLGDKIGLFKTGIGLIISGIALIALVKYGSKIAALVKENTKNA